MQTEGKAVKRMRRILNDTGCYRLSGSDPADWELNAEGAGFDLLEQALDALLGDLYAPSASEAGLERWERLFRGQPSSGSLEDRRAVLLGKQSVNPRRFTPEDLSGILMAAGVEGAAREENGGLTVYCGRLLGVSKEEALSMLDRLLPSHLPWTWNEEVQWEALDAWAPEFAALDGLGLTWDQLEALSREQLEHLQEEGN